MDHLQDFRFDIVGAHGFQDIGQAFRDMDHTETAVIFQGILHGIEDVARVAVSSWQARRMPSTSL